MYCQNCGKQISDEAKFCRYCGAPQTFVTPAANESLPRQSDTRSGAQTSEYHYSYIKKQPAPSARPQPASPVLLVSQSCVYKVAMEQDFKKFEWGGMPEGTVEIYEDRLEFFKKSKMIGLAFGAIGNALSGKGKADLTIPRHMVRRDTVTNKKNLFQFYLTDGQLAFIQFTGISVQKDACSAMWRFLET